MPGTLSQITVVASALVSSASSCTLSGTFFGPDGLFAAFVFFLDHPAPPRLRLRTGLGVGVRFGLQLAEDMVCVVVFKLEMRV